MHSLVFMMLTEVELLTIKNLQLVSSDNQLMEDHHKRAVVVAVEIAQQLAATAAQEL